MSRLVFPSSHLIALACGWRSVVIRERVERREGGERGDSFLAQIRHGRRLNRCRSYAGHRLCCADLQRRQLQESLGDLSAIRTRADQSWIRWVGCIVCWSGSTIALSSLVTVHPDNRRRCRGSSQRQPTGVEGGGGKEAEVRALLSLSSASNELTENTNVSLLVTNVSQHSGELIGCISALSLCLYRSGA